MGEAAKSGKTAFRISTLVNSGAGVGTGASQRDVPGGSTGINRVTGFRATNLGSGGAGQFFTASEGAVATVISEVPRSPR